MSVCIKLLEKLVAIPSVNPVYGGPGEADVEGEEVGLDERKMTLMMMFVIREEVGRETSPRKSKSPCV